MTVDHANLRRLAEAGPGSISRRLYMVEACNAVPELLDEIEALRAVFKRISTDADLGYGDLESVTTRGGPRCARGHLDMIRRRIAEVSDGTD